MSRSNSLKKSKNQPTLTDKRCVLYCRASTEEQTNSIEGQLHAAEQFATMEHLTIIGNPFVDLGTSAVKQSFCERKIAKELITYCKRHNIQTILVHRPDRAFRSAYDLAFTTNQLAAQDLFFRFITPAIDLSTPVGRATIQMLTMVAELEIGIKKERVDYALEAMRRKRVSRNGAETHGNPNAVAPYGWRNSQEPAGNSAKGKPIYVQTPEPAEQAILTHIISEYRAANGQHGILTRIARSLNMILQVPAPSAGKTLIKKGGIPYTPSSEWTAAKVVSVIEHAVIATPEELPQSIDLQSAAEILRLRLERGLQSA